MPKKRIAHGSLGWSMKKRLQVLSLKPPLHQSARSSQSQTFPLFPLTLGGLEHQLSLDYNVQLITMYSCERSELDIESRCKRHTPRLCHLVDFSALKLLIVQADHYGQEWADLSRISHITGLQIVCTPSILEFWNRSEHRVQADQIKAKAGQMDLLLVDHRMFSR